MPNITIDQVVAMLEEIDLDLIESILSGDSTNDYELARIGLIWEGILDYE